jgi:hypothetical protein
MHKYKYKYKYMYESIDWLRIHSKEITFGGASVTPNTDPSFDELVTPNTDPLIPLITCVLISKATYS